MITHVVLLARDLDVRVVRLEERGGAAPALAVRARVLATVVVATNRTRSGQRQSTKRRGDDSRRD